MLDASLEAIRVLPARDPMPRRIAAVSEGFILPGYPGEMGIEIRYFLARVEPWLRAGWRILSRRPGLYPEGSAVVDTELSEAEDALFARYGAARRATGPTILHPAKGGINRIGAAVALAKARRLQEEWRDLLRPYLSAGAGRPWTCWDRDLTTVSTVFSHHAVWKHGDALAPGYLPPEFTSDGLNCIYPDHVGVQFRALQPHPDGRNSDVDTVLAEARAVADHLSLTLLVYGSPQGCALPEGTRTTASLGGGALLSRELGYLRTCRLMLAPNSGWADLMCWLRVPVLVERTGPLSIFDMMASFQPRLLLRQPEVPVQAQVDELLHTGGAWVKLGSGVVDDASLDEWVAAR